MLSRLRAMAAEEIDENRMRGILNGLVNAASDGDVPAYIALVGKKAVEEGLLNTVDEAGDEEIRQKLREVAKRMFGLNKPARQVQNVSSDAHAKP